MRRGGQLPERTKETRATGETKEITGEGMKIKAMAVEMPRVPGHPNRLPFEGVLTLVDVASDRAPAGAKGHRVILTKAAAETALPSLLGMAVDYTPGWDGHDARRKCGIITEANIIGNRLCVHGYLFRRDFPEIEAQMRKSVRGVMGMSYELADAHVADMRASVWTLTKATFTGAAILLREKAAYASTSFRLNDPEQAATPTRLAAGVAAQANPMYRPNRAAPARP